MIHGTIQRCNYLAVCSTVRQRSRATTGAAKTSSSCGGWMEDTPSAGYCHMLRTPRCTTPVVWTSQLSPGPVLMNLYRALYHGMYRDVTRTCIQTISLMQCYILQQILLAVIIRCTGAYSKGTISVSNTQSSKGNEEVCSVSYKTKCRQCRLLGESDSLNQYICIV